MGPPPPTFVKKRPENATDTANVGKSRKVWGNIMELIVKIEKTNTMTNTRRKTKTDKDKNVGECRKCQGMSEIGGN